MYVRNKIHEIYSYIYTTSKWGVLLRYCIHDKDGSKVSTPLSPCLSHSVDGFSVLITYWYGLEHGGVVWRKVYTSYLSDTLYVVNIKDGHGCEYQCYYFLLSFLSPFRFEDRSNSGHHSSRVKGNPHKDPSSHVFLCPLYPLLEEGTFRTLMLWVMSDVRPFLPYFVDGLVTIGLP